MKLSLPTLPRCQRRQIMSDTAKALANALRAKTIMDPNNSNSTWLDAQARAALAAYDAAPPAVRVKPLEWQPHPYSLSTMEECAIADAPFKHRYQIQRDPRASSFMAFLHPRLPITDSTLWWESKGHDTLEAAKAAAQADYEARILAAIVPPAMPTIAQVIEHYGIDALCKALAPEIVREAEQPAPWMPPEDRPDGFECLAQNMFGNWKHVRWQWGRWTIRGDQTMAVHNPSAFAPLPGDAV